MNFIRKEPSYDTAAKQPQRQSPADAKEEACTGSRKKREKIIMVVAIILAVVMVLAATLVVLYQRWVQKPTLPTDNTPSSSVPVSLAPEKATRSQTSTLWPLCPAESARVRITSPSWCSAQMRPPA